MNKQFIRKRRGIALLSLAGVSALLGTGSAKLTSAYLSSREAAANNAGYGDNRIVIEEPDFDPQTRTDYGTTVYPKRVFLKNTGTVPVYARVRLVFSDPAACAASQFTNSSGTFAAAELDEHLPEGWVKGDDVSSGDYYYYTEPLAPSKTTPDLIQSVTTVFPEGSERMDYDIYVRAESVQTKRADSAGNKIEAMSWKDAWKTLGQ